MEVKGLLMVKFCIFSETGYWKHTCEKFTLANWIFLCHVPVQMNVTDAQHPWQRFQALSLVTMLSLFGYFDSIR